MGLMSGRNAKTILITGASGMLGGAILSRLLEAPEGHIVFALNRNPEKQWLTPAAPFVMGDPNGGFDVVVHAGSPASPKFHTNPIAVFEANVPLTQRLVELVKPGGTFVFISTGEVYGPNAKSPVSEDSPVNPVLQGPRSYYPLAKIAGESIALSRNDVRSVVLRTFHTFGPGVRKDDGRSFADLLWGAVANRSVSLTSSGSAIRSFLSDLDFVEAVMVAVESPDVRGFVNVGSPLPVSIRDFAEKVAIQSGSEVVFSHSTGVIASQIDVLYPNVDKLISFGWEQKVTLEVQISRTLEWIAAKQAD